MNLQIKNPYFVEMKLGLKEDHWSKYNFILSFTTIFIQAIISFLLFRNIFKYSTAVDSTQITLYYIIVNIVALSMNPAMFIAWKHMNYINDGTMILRSMRTYNYLIAEYIKCFGSFVLRLGINMIFIYITSFVLDARIPILNLAYGFVSVIEGFTILYLIQALIGCISVWAHDIIRLRDLIMTLLFILGGRIIPSEYLYSVLKNIIYFTPVPYVYDIPAKMFIGKGNLLDMSIQLMWCITFYIVYEYIYRVHVKRNLEFGS